MNSSLVVWQPVAALPLRYAIESSAPRALEKARQLFAPWLVARELVADEGIESRFWRLEDNGDDLWSVANAGDDYLRDEQNWDRLALAQLLMQIEYNAMSHLATQLADFIGLHGALLSREFEGQRRAVILVGPKEAGKSTLACALWRAGWSLHCDDFTLLDNSSHAHATARRVSLRAGSRELLGDLWQQAQRTPSAQPTTEGFLFHPHELDGARVQCGPLKIGAICFLQRRESQVARAQAAPLSGIAAALALLPYSTLLLAAGTMRAAPEEGDWSAKLALLARRIANLKLYDVGRGAPDEMVRAIERLVG